MHWFHIALHSTAYTGCIEISTHIMCYGYHIWSKEALMQAENDDDLDGGQRSSEVKWGKLCEWLPFWSKELVMQAKNEDDLHGFIRGQMGETMWYYHDKNYWYKLIMMMTFTEVKCLQRSNVVNYATKLGRKSSWCKFRMTNLHGGQRPTEVKYSE